MKTTDFAFDLPAELIAQTPLPERSASRLLHVDGDTASLSHRSFKDLPLLLTRDDLLVFAKGCGHDPQVLAVSEEAQSAGL